MQVLVFLSDNNVPSEMSLCLSKEKNFIVLETFVNRGEENETYVMLELNKETVSDLIFTLQNLRNKMS